MHYKTDINARKAILIQLLNEIESREEQILQALYDDFKKPFFEGILTETSFVKSELKATIKNIHRWTKPKNVFPSILNFPSLDCIYKEPFGKVLIIAPWNYPFQLAICPLVAAVAAGNQVVLKPSELTQNTSRIIGEIIRKIFDQNHVEVIEGDHLVAQNLLAQRWDYIFFTGSVAVGKIVAEAAAKFLTPLTLELGGKNPGIIDQTANLELAAKRIVWGKFINGGQTCIAPDYLLVHSKIKMVFIGHLINVIKNAYGENPQLSEDFCRIVNLKNWQRLQGLLKGNTILHGGQTNEKELYIAPTIIDEPELESALMKDEIFGPLLPIISFETDEDLSKIILRYEKPLSLYVFSTDKTFSKKIMRDYAFGGGCINDTVIHFANKRLPFGGVGHSGIGAYHGRWSFDTFSHQKAVVKKSNWLDLPFRYAPYKNKLAMIRKLLHWF
ncbi:aldehyde dehydrogenase [Flavobacterium sp.]|uniref:aldehyde dehydrogenase n=1 Tax=Flavobacterium sp. TaxID=239 RepID=UPI00262AC7B5|nr:aldehyde dehydrogenase [Flavobacterium sp.]